MMMLFGRVLQGFGLAGPRIVSIALIRDLYVGDSMARVMSFVMSVFILVPAIAPAVGQGIMQIWSWQAIFGLFLGLGAIVSVWFALRQPETLKLEKRIPFTPRRLATGVREVCLNRHAFGHTIAAGLIFGPFAAYLSMAQQILQIQYGLGEDFPLYFALLALSIGAAFFTNSRLVVRYGMRRMIGIACPAISIWSLFFLGIVWFYEGQPSLLLLILYLQVTFFCMGILFGNLNAMAMQTLGHIAGIGAAIVGFFSTTIGVTFGSVIGQLYDQSISPLVVGYILGSAFSILAIGWANGRALPPTGSSLQ
jgi:DHA1 family bicyclomycin/chloramphenicol resistance-like MFS transporter